MSIEQGAWVGNVEKYRRAAGTALAMPGKTRKSREVEDQDEKRKRRGKCWVAVLNAVELDRFGVDELARWRDDDDEEMVTMRG